MSKFFVLVVLLLSPEPAETRRVGEFDNLADCTVFAQIIRTEMDRLWGPVGIVGSVLCVPEIKKGV